MRLFFFLFSSSFLGLYQCLIPLGWAASPRLTPAASAQQRPQKKGQAAPRMPTTPPPPCPAKKGSSPPTPRGGLGQRGAAHTPLAMAGTARLPSLQKYLRKHLPVGKITFPPNLGISNILWDLQTPHPAPLGQEEPLAPSEAEEISHRDQPQP